MRDQVNMEDEAKLHSPICSTFEALVVVRRFGMIMEKNEALFVDQSWLQALQFSVHLIDLLNNFSDVIVSPGFRKLQWVTWAGDHYTMTLIFFWCKFSFGKGFGASSRSDDWAGCCRLYKIYFSLHVTIRSLLLHRIREDDTSKWQLLWFAVSSRGTHLSSFFTFPICFKWGMTLEGLTLSSWATSHVVVRSASMILSIGCCQFPVDDHYASHLQGCHLLCKTSWTTTALYVYLLAVPGPNVLLMLGVVSIALQPILNSNKKITGICFLSNIISLD